MLSLHNLERGGRTKETHTRTGGPDNEGKMPTLLFYSTLVTFQTFQTAPSSAKSETPVLFTVSAYTSVIIKENRVLIMLP